MKLFLISQTENSNYDAYDSAVVCAADADSALLMDPGHLDGRPAVFKNINYSSWCSSPDKVSVRYLGEAAPGVAHGVLCASFNAE